jgi:hypothetical protein
VARLRVRQLVNNKGVSMISSPGDYTKQMNYFHSQMRKTRPNLTGIPEPFGALDHFIHGE